ncbi:MAG: hypothetical protein Q7S16_02225 [bacterium]|nr:hypothetical protein [bacterium]
MSKTTVIPISLPTVFAKEIDRAANEEAMTRSEFVRTALRRQLAFSSLGALQRETSRRAQKVGIRTLRDAVRVVREARKERVTA